MLTAALLLSSFTVSAQPGRTETTPLLPPLAEVSEAKRILVGVDPVQPHAAEGNIGDIAYGVDQRSRIAAAQQIEQRAGMARAPVDGARNVLSSDVTSNMASSTAAVAQMAADAQLAPMANVGASDAGLAHTCALVNYGGVNTGFGVKCWGENNVGQLGDNSTTKRLAPVDVSGLTTGVTAIAAGGYHTCALTSAGGVKCWGSGKVVPEDVPGLASGVFAIAAGGFHTCALTSAGGVKCWGSNSHGQLGDNSTTNRPNPVDVEGLASGVLSIVAGGFHTCALLNNSGEVKCWGRNSEGQLGDGTTVQRMTPVQVHALGSGAVEIAAGDAHNCVKTAGGAVQCWGWNEHGQVGDGGTTNQKTPVNVAGLAGLMSVGGIAAGGAHTCAVTTAPGELSGVKCWGRNSHGQLGDNTNADRLTPTSVIGLPSIGFGNVRPGGYHTCALTGGPGFPISLMCWGRNVEGQLGDNSMIDRFTPVDVLDDTSPEPFSFAPLSNAPRDSIATASPITPVGYFTAALIVVSNGEYSIGCTGTFTAAAGRISPGQSVCVRHVTASTYGSTVTTTLTIGGISGSFSSTTAGPPTYLLTVSKAGSGTGSVSSSPAGISCGADCTENYSAGTQVTLTAAAGAGSTFGGWSGGGCSGSGVCQVTMNAAATVTATFYLIPDTTPDPFSFTPQTGVATGATVTSDAIRPTGTNFTSPISIVNGEYSIGCGPANFTSAPGSYPVGWSVCVRHTASATPGGTVTTTLTIGGISGSFSSTTAGPPTYLLTVSKAGSGTGSVSSSPAGISCGADCTESYSAGTQVTLTAAAGAGSTFAGWSGNACAGIGTCLVTMNAAKTVTATFNVAVTPGSVAVAPMSVNFGGQSMFTPSVARTVTVSNTGATAVLISALNMTGPFAVKGHTCGTLPALLAGGASCTANLTFTPPGDGAYNGSLTVASDVGGVVVPLSGVGERSLVVHYYGAILNRNPDAGGKAWWEDQVDRMQGLGADINEVWYAMAMSFFNSVEYLGFSKSNEAFVDDLYRTFLNREADVGGRAFWLSRFDAGLTREVVLVAFMFSDEFRQFTASIFGNTAVRPELNAVMDFYRGLLSRLPDDDGFDFWVDRFQLAQCTGAAAVTAEAEAFSGEFARGAEYANRNRSNSQYVGDLYNAILRRGGDGPGVQFWINAIATGALTREQVRQQFVQSAEFQGRVAQIIAAGCLP